MNEPDERLVISSTKEDGRPFRPGDWVERLSSALARFDTSHRLRYPESLHPCIVDGEKCLVVARGLEKSDPETYAFVMEFARSNNLRVFADRRRGARALVPSE